jgi:tripeptide aminopeptidase
MNQSRLLDRFLEYTKMDTQSDEASQDTPSTRGQLVFGRKLLEELQEMGLKDARQNEYGLVYATIPATIESCTETIAFCAHLDTSPETSGSGVRPRVLEEYDGKPIRYPGDAQRVLDPAEFPELANYMGKTLVTSDGTTLLGGDDKAGVAVIMETAAFLLEHPEIEHGPIRLCFTCDEEIGRGIDPVDLKDLPAAACYTVDSSGCGGIDVETFSADLATIEIEGVNIHPGEAKGKMVNAVRVASRLIDRLPLDEKSPETTAERQGFLHPIEMQGNVERMRIRLLVRDFEEEGLENLEALLQQTMEKMRFEFPNAALKLSIRRQYRNMREGLRGDRRVIEYAEEAIRRVGLNPVRKSVRGGTDGSQLTAKGLPTPNLGNGQHLPHSTLEWVCLEEMVLSAEVLVELSRLWCE